MSRDRTRELDRFSALLDSIYDAATDPAQWSVFLRQLAETLHAKSGMFRVIDERGPAVRSNVHYNLDPELQAAHARYFVGVDPFVEALRDKPAGYVAMGERILAPRELRRTEFFTDYCAPQDTHHVCGGLAMRNQEFTIKFGLQRDARAGPFSQTDEVYIRRCVPHIQRAARLGHLLDLADRSRAAAESALESLSVGLVLLDNGHRVLHANANARQSLHRGAGLALRDGRLHAARHPDRQRLPAILDEAALRSRGARPPIPESMLLTPAAGEPQLLVVACPVRAHHAHFLGPWRSPAVAVFISNLDDAGLLNHEVLIQLYGLTATEARLACALAQGRDLADLAGEWDTSRETLRTHLKRVLAKTATSRQAELVRLLAGKPWTPAPPEAEDQLVTA